MFFSYKPEVQDSDKASKAAVMADILMILIDIITTDSDSL